MVSAHLAAVCSILNRDANKKCSKFRVIKKENFTKIVRPRDEQRAVSRYISILLRVRLYPYVYGKLPDTVTLRYQYFGALRL